MAWYPLLQSGVGTPPSVGDEFFDDQSATGGWPLWTLFGSSADEDGHDSHSAGVVRAEKHGGDERRQAAEEEEEEEEEEGPPPPQQLTQPTDDEDDIFMSQLEALDMLPDSMHRLLSYENMLSGMLTGCSEDDQPQQQEVDTCGFPLPLFSHDLLQNAPPVVVVPGDLHLLTPPKGHQDGASFLTKKRSRSIGDEGSLFLEAPVLQELEDVVFQLTKRTRVCFRDAFLRLAECSRAHKLHSAANGATPTPSSETGLHQTEGNASRRMSTPAEPGCPERETNAIDRAVADLTMKAQRRPEEVLVDSAAEAPSAASWMTTA